ncbi:AAA family ATPase [Streptomyces noursei]
MRLHQTYQSRTLTPATVTNPRKETFGWKCDGCSVSVDGYTEERASRHDAADHERRMAQRLFAPGTLVVLIGPAGSGKSTFARAFPSTSVVSLDDLRGRLSDDCGEQTVTPQAVQLQDLIAETRLARGLTTVIDSTNVEARVRAGLIERARRHGRPVVAVVLCPEVEVCTARNRQRPRNRRVPLDTVRRQHAETVAALPRLTDEGFAEVRVIDHT